MTVEAEDRDSNVPLIIVPPGSSDPRPSPPPELPDTCPQCGADSESFWATLATVLCRRCGHTLREREKV